MVTEYLERHGGNRAPAINRKARLRKRSGKSRTAARRRATGRSWPIP